MPRGLGQRCWSLLRSTWDGWWKDDGLLLSAATAYYAAFALFPLCMVLIATLGFLGRYSAFLQIQQRELLNRLSQEVSPWVAEELQAVLAGVQAGASIGGPLGLLMLIVAAIGIFMQLQNTFDRIWGVPSSAARGWLAAVRTALWDRLLAFLMLLAIGVLLVTVSLTDVILAGLRPYLAQLPAGRSTWHVLQSLLTVGCDAMLLAAVYHVLTKARVRWRDAVGGGVLAAAVWAVGRHVLVSLLVGEKYSLYGIVGGLMGVMLWFYYASAVVFLGAEFAHALGQSARKSDN